MSKLQFCQKRPACHTREPAPPPGAQRDHGATCIFVFSLWFFWKCRGANANAKANVNFQQSLIGRLCYGETCNKFPAGNPTGLQEKWCCGVLRLALTFVGKVVERIGWNLLWGDLAAAPDFEGFAGKRADASLCCSHLPNMETELTSLFIYFFSCCGCDCCCFFSDLIRRFPPPLSLSRVSVTMPSIMWW